MRKFYSKRTVIFLILIVLVLSIACTTMTRAEKPAKVKNVIVLIGDGMGNQQRRIAALVEGNGERNHRLAMEIMTTSGVAFNHSMDAIVTDSAASGTALSTGFKTNNGMIGMTPDQKVRKTILEVCKDLGKSTGLVTTVTITHATPACFGSHVNHRSKYPEIAVQYLKGGIDVLMGGGQCDYLPESMKGKRKDGRNLIEEYKKAGYVYMDDIQGLKKLNPEKDQKVLGLFTDGAMAYEVDRDPSKEPSIEEMTKASIDVLSRNPKGFFLMVEGGKIDWANHANDVSGSVYDTIAFDKAVKAALDYAKKNNDTLVIVVNDHETGGMTIASTVNISAIKKLRSSSERMQAMLRKDGSNIREVFRDHAGITNHTDKERQMVEDEVSGKLKTRDEWGYGGSIIAHIISKRTGVMFSTGGHSGAPVILAAYGPGSSIFDGFYDQSDIPKKIAELLGVKFPF